MTRSKQMLFGLVFAFAFTFLITSPQVFATTSDDKDKKDGKNIWDVVSDIQSQLSMIEQKITTTVSVGGSTTTGTSNSGITSGTPSHPHHVKVKHQTIHNTLFTPNNPDVYYTSLSMGGDVPIQPILQQTDIPPQCNSVNVGTVANPDYEVLGWCPDSHQVWYFIQDARVTQNSLITLNIQDAPVSDTQEAVNAPSCRATQTGTFAFATQNMTGFVLQCDPNTDLPVADEPMVYIVLN